MIYPEYSITDLIQDSANYKDLQAVLQDYNKHSDEYLLTLINKLPLNSWPNYKTFLDKQGVPRDSTTNEDTGDKSQIYRSSLSPSKLITCVDHKLRTFFDHFMFSVRMWPQNDFLGVRTFQDNQTWSEKYYFQTYEQVAERVHNLGSGILTIVNMKLNRPITVNNFIVSILSHNSPEWVITDLACQNFSLINTSLYETLGPSTSEYILNLTESPVLCFAKVNFYKILNNIDKFKFLNTLICLDEDDEEKIDLINTSLLLNKFNGKNERITLYSMKKVENIGSITNIPSIPPKPDSIYTISFTSGTTGLPKGVEIAQQNVESAIVFGLSTFKIPNSKKSQQLYDMCFLPLAHIFQRQILAYDVSRGIGIGFLHKPDPTILVEDLKILKPDSLALVPRILTRFEAGIKTNLSRSSIQKNVATNIIDAKTSRFIHRSGVDRSIMNYLVYHRILIDKIRDGLGLINTNYLVTGSAPIAKDTLLFLRSALDIGMRQGYGLTESFAGICLSEPYEKDPGSCGAVGITAECRLKDVPEMNYFAKKDLKGELQLRGPQIFQRYYKNDDATNEVVDENGWFSTGDIGYIDDKGRIHIIDRVKNFFKLAHGEYIAPEKIENIYLSSCPYITQIFIYGNPLKTFLVGVVSVDITLIQELLNHYDIKISNWNKNVLLSKLNHDKSLKSMLLKNINKCIDGLQGFEKIHNIYVGIDLMTVENDTVTPTFKIRRLQASNFFQDKLNKLYDEGSIIKNSRL